MDEQIETLTIDVRAETGGFAADMNRLRSELDGSLAGGLERAGQRLETGLVRALRSGNLGFEDLRRTALSVLDEIAAAALSTGLNSLFGGNAGQGGGLVGGLLGLLGLPGRATGGPVSPGRAYRVGERGPEVFVPTTSGRIETGGARGGGPVNITVHVHGQRDVGAPQALQRSSRQIARMVQAGLANG